MVYVLVEVSCAPQGEGSYPVPTTFKLVRVFASRADANAEWNQGDTVHRAEAENAGQDVYYLVWNTSEPLNLDRHTTNTNNTSNCGMWLPDSKRVFSDTTDIHYELRPPARVIQKARKRQQVSTISTDGNKYQTARNNSQWFDEEDEDEHEYGEYRPLPPPQRRPVYGRRGGGTPWKML